LFAIKVQKKEHIMLKKNSQRVNSEQRILAKSTNPFIIKLFYSFQTEENLFLVMEYSPGGDCLSLLEKVGYLEEFVAKSFIAEMVLALEYLHNNGVVHRDLKPDNMLIGSDGHIKLTDFGLSVFGIKESLEQQSDRNYVLPTVTEGKLTRREKSYSCVGTPDYLAPEILRGTGHDAAVDWWSLGVIAFEFLSGFAPFSADSMLEVFENIQDPDRELPWPEHVEISLAARDFITNLLKQQPNERLGIRGKGFVELKKHPFFEGIDWDHILEQKAAFIPKPKNATDTSYFDDRSEMHQSVNFTSDLQDLSIRNKASPRGSPSPQRNSEFKRFELRNLSHLEQENQKLLKKHTNSGNVSNSGIP